MKKTVLLPIVFVVVLLAAAVMAEAQQSGKSSAWVSWIIALLLVSRSSWRLLAGAEQAWMD
jgi:isoprenylcysteine carboxyl methyltransferase (ICMT) family protein YpbQ